VPWTDAGQKLANYIWNVSSLRILRKRFWTQSRDLIPSCRHFGERNNTFFVRERRSLWGSFCWDKDGNVRRPTNDGIILLKFFAFFCLTTINKRRNERVFTGIELNTTCHCCLKWLIMVYLWLYYCCSDYSVVSFIHKCVLITLFDPYHAMR
jgi:hypothetical protein